MVSIEELKDEFFGDYRIVTYLGKTLWSQDLLAEHRFIKKRYILKVVRDELASLDGFMSVFHETIVKLAKVQHFGLLNFENVSQFEGRYFLVTQEKELPILSLSQYLGSKNLGELEIVNILGQLANVLDFAHSHDLVHGGLDLESIYIDVSGDMPRISLPELGFAHFLRNYLTKINLNDGDKDNLLSKIQYLNMFEPPEGGEATASRDIYAFGVVAYILLMGIFPKGIFPMPSQTLPDYHYDWDHLLLSCLSYSPESRANTLSSLIVKKTLGEQFNNVKAKCSREELRVIVEETLPQEDQPIPQAIIRQGEEFASPDSSRLEFVLVEAKSIDEAMNTSIDGPKEIVEKEDGYSEALQSLLVREPVVSRYIEEEKQEANRQPLSTEMVFIEGGSFIRGGQEGQRDEQPDHEILLPSFFLDIHPVTNEQFVRYLESIGSEQDKHYNELIRLRDSRIQRRSGKLVIEPGYAKHPVVGVTWYGATSYAAWIGKRLPTEAEWEVAASGGKARLRYPCGEEIDKSLANFFSSDTTPVMSYPANSLGLYDMAGNVYEWCQDWYGYDFYEISAQEPDVPQGPPQGVYRVLRGGCWKSLKEDLRCAHRHRNNPGAVNSTYGFRCAKGVD
ncbi:serine/threonine-protein kinase pkn1 [Chlamydia ibidis]|uniref:non-specific serine/threonine protein kinase n=2 Tax=Chlamydia ibidis TaxID=1405396 RepID=S7J248_9CHLA|nr:SUMF1/EgtB/PvdO family nonheme iron enzyme [Chlamydia ibidis]EPP34298.1 serine/threonine-protein kinase pkn1 [Chlamydia ibidis]EQM62687.1 serine/threonine-protein kinase pkn1 [Chlamydia ibidis 10-1398/6]